MESFARKAAVLGWKERKAILGIYSLRCTATGEVWVGSSPTLDRVQNRLWFTLKMKSATPESLQAAWDTHGEAAMTFEAIEQIDEKDIAFSQRATLLERRDAWAAELGATVI